MKGTSISDCGLALLMNGPASALSGRLLDSISSFGCRFATAALQRANCISAA
jgi:hypothetical protein